MRCASTAGIAPTWTLQALIDKIGVGFVYVGRTLDRYLACSRCGAHDVHCQIHNLHSNRFRFAD
jgi:hypothetical protein